MAEISMMKNIAFLLLPLLFFQCKGDDQSEMIADAPSISVSAVNDLTEPLCVGATLTLNASLRTDETVGISEVVVVRNGDEIANETGFNLAATGYTFDYVITATDFEESPIRIDIVLFDNEGRSRQGGVSVDVTTEFSYLHILPVWVTTRFDLVENEFMNDIQLSFPGDIDLLLDTESCGTDCFHNRITFSTDLGTVIYAFPGSDVISPDNLELKQFDVTNSLVGQPNFTELMVYSDFPEDLIGGTPFNAFPLVFKIRDSEEFAILEFDETTQGMYYRKRTPEAGGE